MVSDLKQPGQLDDEDVLAIATLRCRCCWPAGHDTRVVLQVPTWAKVGDYLYANCGQCITRPDVPLLADESGVFEVITIKRVSASM
jgi:hypothetical protein